MQQQRVRKSQLVLMAALVVGAGLLGYAIASLGRNTAQSNRDAPSASQAAAPAITAVPSAAAALPGPTPTFVPTGPNVEAPTTAATPSSAPVVEAPTATTASEPPSDPVRSNRQSVTLEDTAWQGGYRQARGYGGRSATWIYGTGTEYSTMEAVFQVTSAASGVATLTIEGMDSEDRAKTPIRISVNRRTVFEGPNPLPNDDMPLDSGTWASASFEFDASLLQAGPNTIRIDNLKPGRFSLPPFFMLDYATLEYTSA